MATDPYAPRPYNLPPHGTRRRYRNLHCRCVACTRGPHTGKSKADSLPSELRWPYRFLERKFTADFIQAWYPAEQIAKWKADGLGDFEADEVCIHLGEFPHNVFPGYETAGLDSGFYP